MIGREATKSIATNLRCQFSPLKSLASFRAAHKAFNQQLGSSSQRAGAMQQAAAAPKLQPTLSIRMKDVYEVTPVGGDLDTQYGDNVGGPPKHRRAGVILHPTSLPGPYGSGEIGKEALRFVDWLESTGSMCWQVLPLVPPERGFWSPYSGLDAMCGNVLLIALDELRDDGLIDDADLPQPVPVDNADFAKVAKVKTPILNKATRRLLTDPKFAALKGELEAWRKENDWVEDSALFYCLATFNEKTKEKEWWTWPNPLRFREPAALKEATEKWRDDIENFVAEQFLFDRQWKAVKAYANERNISIVGDMPIYVGAQSADVWCFPDLFELGESGAPIIVSGVPPDAFSETGQLWGSPLYDWQAQKKAKYVWWERRLGRAFQLYDETRIDHFRGFAGDSISTDAVSMYLTLCALYPVYVEEARFVGVASVQRQRLKKPERGAGYWAVDAKEETAMNGVWKRGPGKDLFDVLDQKLKGVPIIAEDLGVITPDVHELREAIGAPGMVVLQFAWGSGATNTHLPHNHYENSVCYPGTHDNETMEGWWKDSATDKDKAFIKQYLGLQKVEDISWVMLREAFKSISRTSIVMMQDVMRLDNSARMNFPGTVENNWIWRVGDTDVWKKLSREAEDFKVLLQTYDRLAPSTKTHKP